MSVTTLKETDAVQSPVFLASGGEMGVRMRAFDWSSTALGPPAEWPQSLKTIVRIMLDSRYAMWMLWGPQLTFFCNDAYLPTVGIKRDWVLGARSDKVWEEIWPEIGPRIERVLHTGQATWDEGLLLFLERSGYTEETYHTFSYSPVSDDAGVVAGMLCVVTEVTERIISERRLSFLGRFGSALAGADSEVEVLAALQQAAAADARDLPFAVTYQFDQEGVARRTGETAIDRIHSAFPDVLPDMESDETLWPTAEMRTGASAVTVSTPSERIPDLPRGPWTVAPHQARAVPIVQQGQIQSTGFLIAGLNPYRMLDESYAAFLDLIAAQLAAGLAAARARAEERRRAEALEELDRAKTAFFSNVSHEFRTPLTLMMGPLEDALQEGAQRLDPGTREALGAAHRNSMRLLKLVNSLLDFSRLEAGRARANFEPVDLAALTLEVASSFKPVSEKAGLRFVVSCESGVGTVPVDRQMWEEMVLNLVSNAFKYTLSGEIRVSLESAGESALLTVADTGCGIPGEALPHLFERFYRVPDARGRTHEGTGIGLALVQEIVNLHGASIEVRSQLGEGTTVLVTVPGRTASGASVRMIEPESSATRAQAFVTEAQGWLPDSQGAPTIAVQRNSGNGFPEAQLPSAARAADGIVMLAEDNADMRDYIRRLLEQRFTVVTARDGLEALELLRKNKPDLLLTDVMMPHLDGFGLLRAVREDPQSAQLPVILLSARAGEESRVEGLQHGADDYLVKPFSARELLARVSTHIGLARLKRESREAVQRIEQRFSIAVESSAIGFCIFDAVRDDRERIVDFTLSYINPAGALALGRPPEKLVGLCVSDAALVVWDASMFLDAFVRTVETGESLNVEVHSTAGAGWFHNIATKLGDGLVVWFTETTQAKNAEARLRASREELRRVTDIASVMLAHCDRDNRYLFVNRAYAARFGLTPGQVVGRTIPEVVGERAFAAFQHYALQALAGERIEFEVEIPYERIGAHFMHCVYEPDVDATGRVQGFVAAISDVSERRALEQQLREADRRKDEFLATLAHELRNPLAPIRQAAEIAKALNATDAQLSWSHAVIERQVTHMALLLDDLLDVSRITRGKLDLRQEHIDLQGVIDAAIETARPTIEGRGHTLSIEVDPVPVPLYADRVRLAQVLANLLTNAAKYTDRGGFIRLRANVDAQEVTVRVTDNGSGIASDALLSIFEMFYQVSSALQRADGGLGIGLALVKGLVELHGGTVEAHSEGLGHGSEFIVRLPLAPADALAAPSSRSTQRIESSNAPSRLRVLIADDNRDAAQSLAVLLQMEGYEVHLAFDGDDAVTATAQFLPRVLLLDIGMPKRNGYEVAESLRAQDSLGPMTLIALTGWGKSQDKDRALSSGFDHHLTKPVDISAVLALLDRVARGDDVRGMSAS